MRGGAGPDRIYDGKQLGNRRCRSAVDMDFLKRQTVRRPIRRDHVRSPLRVSDGKLAAARRSEPSKICQITPNLLELRRLREMSGAVLARVRSELKVRRGDRHPRARGNVTLSLVSIVQRRRPHFARSSGEVVDAGYFLLQ